MNPLFCILLTIAIFLIASKFYAGLIARKLGVDPARPTPAHTFENGRDFVPTRPHVLFAHHFSAIAGAGPILGPTMVLLYGYAPAWLWVVVGSIFFGAVHDFTALFVSIREGGRSMAEVARRSLGQLSFMMFISFAILMLLLVVSNFLAATAVSLTSMWPLAKLGLPAGQTLLRVVPSPSGEPLGVIGGIASTSVIIITLCSPLLGYALYRRGLRSSIAYVIASAICVASIAAGIYCPLSLAPRVWMIILSVYVFFAASLPVWLILQPRDFINVQILYVGLILLTLGVLIAGLSGEHLTFPAFRLAEGTQRLGGLWPMLFITVACGAISGFHALVAGGTTAKQIDSEAHVKRIGYDAMLLEALLAVLVLLTLGLSVSSSDYSMLVWPSAEEAAVHPSNPILAFSLAVGRLLWRGLSIPQAFGTVCGILLVEGFVITTLDAAVRLARYLLEELWLGLWGEEGRIPAWLRSSHVNTLIVIVLMCFLAFTNSFQTLWPLFGTSNQLLAALTLIVVSAWLLQHGRSAVFTLIPAIFMMATTLASLVILLRSYIKSANYVLLTADLLLLALALATVALAYTKLMAGKSKLAAAAAPADPFRTSTGSGR